MGLSSFTIHVIAIALTQFERLKSTLIGKTCPTLRYNIANVRLGEHDLSKEKVSLYTKFIHPLAKVYAWLEIYACSRLDVVSLCICCRIWSRTKTLFYESRWSSILKIGNKNCAGLFPRKMCRTGSGLWRCKGKKYTSPSLVKVKDIHIFTFGLFWKKQKQYNLSFF